MQRRKSSSLSFSISLTRDIFCLYPLSYTNFRFILKSPYLRRSPPLSFQTQSFQLRMIKKENFRMEGDVTNFPPHNPLATGFEVPSQADIIALIDPHCSGQQELPNASQERARVAEVLRRRNDPHISQTDRSDLNKKFESSPLFHHLAHGLAYTVGSALGSTPPSIETYLAAYLVPNSAGLTAGSRAWSKHSHRSQPPPSDEVETAKRTRSAGWWGIAAGPVSVINEKSLALFWKVMNNTTWRNLHWLPHQVLVYEVRVSEGYGMRWSQDQGDSGGDDSRKEDHPWTFRGFVEPMMENGHELKWRHPISP